MDVRRARAAGGLAGTPLGACLDAVASAPLGWQVAAVPALKELERKHGPTACSSLYLARFADRYAPPSERVTLMLEHSATAIRLAPAVPLAWRLHSTALSLLGREAEAVRDLEEAVRRAEHPLDRLVALLTLRNYHLTRSDTAAAARLSRAIAAAVARDGRPGVRHIFLDPLRPGLSDAARDDLAARALRIAQRHRAWPIQFTSALSVGSHRLNVGDPAGALSALDEAVRLADSVASAHLQLMAYRLRGRALAKLGRLEEAERDLGRSLAAAPAADDSYNLAETYHNLAHVFEGAGRLREAARAADRFVELTRSLRYEQPRVMSLHDAGIIRWKAGWHAAANASFDEMVRAVDEQDANHYWAGQHFERTGDLTRALDYYRRGAAPRLPEASLNLAGMVRVYEALGRADSAERAAREHDRLLDNQLDVPLLPDILARRGQAGEAVRIAREWAQRQRGRGNIQGAAIAQVQLAELLLGAGRAREALGEANRADTLSDRLNLTDQRIDALRLQGEALLRLGRRMEGLALLRRAAMLADAHPTTPGVLRAYLALGDGVARFGPAGEALAAYHRAARAVESTALRLDEDLDWSRYRSLHLAPFDGALRVLRRAEPTNGALDRIVLWSQRRKAASIALAAGHAPATADGQLSRAQLERRIAPGQALVDYLVLDDVVSALVIADGRTRLVELAAGADSIARMVDRLRRPFNTTFAGRVDLARAPYDLALAHHLYAAIVAPLEPFLAKSERVVVVPDGALHRVPFDALVRAAPPPGKRAYLDAQYLIDRYELTLLPSAQLLGKRINDAPFRSSDRVLAVALGAPGGAREVSAIGRAWGEARVRTVEGTAATEGAVRAAGDEYAILHFATHAVADDGDPLASHLRLGADAEHDGYLHAAEIAGESHRARLVVLSACRTMEGPYYAGAGLIGIARAFLAGGARSVVATTWPIGPATADLMEGFYAGMARGAAPAASLRAAKLRLRRDGRTAHPFFWASFVLVAGG